MIHWHHIMDKQPENGRAILQIDVPWDCDFLGDFKKCYPIGLRKWDILCTWEEVLKFYRDSDLKDPNYWWCYATDFPFPQSRERR